MSEPRRISFTDLSAIGPGRVVIRRHWASDGWGLFLFVMKHDPAVGYVKRHLTVTALEVRDDEPGGFFPPQPPIFLAKEQGGVQELMDELWREGVRPSFKADLTRTEEHLAHVTRLLDDVLPRALRAKDV